MSPESQERQRRLKGFAVHSGEGFALFEITCVISTPSLSFTDSKISPGLFHLSIGISGVEEKLVRNAGSSLRESVSAEIRKSMRVLSTVEFLEDTSECLTLLLLAGEGGAVVSSVLSVI
jgi:hypothetical protein